jgi:trk system potassium uptake protein TrkH
MRNRFRTLHVILNQLGSLLLVLGVFILIPLVIVGLSGEFRSGWNSVIAFVIPSALCFAVGTLLRRFFHGGNPNQMQAMLVCSLGWLSFSAIGALPFVFMLNSHYLDGFFEAMSGFTTTGITMFTGLDVMPRSILFWRSMTQWIGGLGILTFFLAVTFRGGSAHALFGAESHKVDVDRPVPGLAHTLKILWAIYVGFTVFILASLIIAGMPFFDSICHSFTCLSTGGFSTHDASIEFYRLAHYPHFIWIEYILVLGMVLGGTNFLIHFRILQRDWKALYDTKEIKYWWTIIAGCVVLVVLERFLKTAPITELISGTAFWHILEENLRTIIFQVVAIVTTTGFSTKDIGSSYFGNLAVQLFLIMMVIGGCVGSTGGGIKVFRVTVLVQLIKREIFRSRVPRRARTDIIIDGRSIDANEVYRISSLFFAWVVLLVIGGCLTALLSNHGALASFSGMFSALGNIGPCFITVADMGQLNPAIKIVYIIGMLAGRLEILPVLLLFSGKAWRL